jgi:parallel beta-helix repeat protein
MPNLYVSGRADLLSALSSATGGETIVLQDGNYGSLDLEDLHFNDYVTIRSATPLGAKFSEISVDGSSYVRIDAVHVSNGGNGAPSSKVVTIDGGSRHVEFINSEVNGLEDGKNTGHYGIHTGSADDVRISNNYVHDVKNGIVVLGTSGIEVVGNEVDEIGSDAMKFAGVTGALIENNTGPRTITLDDPSWHMDFIQIQGSLKDAVIRGNVFIPENNVWSQGIFAGKGFVLTDVLIEQNIIYTGIMNGIKVYDGSGIVARNNTVLNIPQDGHNATVLSVPSGSVVENNISSSTSGSMSGSNIVAQHAKPGQAYHYDQLFENAQAGLGASLEDFRPVKGSLAESKGAAQRLAELLDGASPVEEPEPAPPPVAAEPEPAPEAKPAPEPEPTPTGAEVTLEADGGMNGRTGAVAWGEGVTIEAFGLNGKAAALDVSADGIGVAGGRTNRLDYDGDAGGRSEKLLIDFGTDVHEVGLDFAGLNHKESGLGETGLWIARDAAGRVVDQGKFGGGTGTVGSNWTLDLEIDAEAPFRTLELRATPLGHGADGSPGDNSDFLLSAVTFTPSPAAEPEPVPNPEPIPQPEPAPGVAVTLEAEGAMDGRKGTVAWGEGVTIEAFGLDGKAAALDVSADGIGVAGGRTSQLDYDGKTGRSEKLLIDFGTDVGEAELDFALLNGTEYGGLGETGLWIARDAAGRVVDQGKFGGGIGAVGDKWELELEIDADAPFRTLELQATAYGHGAKEPTGDNSDFLLSAVTFTPEYMVG